MKPVSVIPWPGNGGIIQVTGTDVFARSALTILKDFACKETGYTTNGSLGERIYTYRVEKDIWQEVRRKIEDIPKSLQLLLFEI